jgi:TIR domain
MRWDLFISHASEDKDDVARPLANLLLQQGLKVWYDEYALTIGDSLRRSIDRGLAGSRFGLVILSPHFLQKEWTQRELDGLVAREDGSEKRILPVWHNVSRSKVVSFSPPLADKLGVTTAKGLDHVVREIMRVFQTAEGTSLNPPPITKRPSPQRKKVASPKATDKGKAILTWVMIDRLFFPAHKVQQNHDGTFQITIVTANSEEEADLESLRPQRHGVSGGLPFAVRNDAHLVRVTGCERELSGQTARWTLTLAPEDHNLGGSDLDATINEEGKSYSPDAVARFRAGRLLVNDPPLQEQDRMRSRFSLLQGTITGSGKYQVRESVIRTVFKLYGERTHWRELARLQAIFLLKATGTVDDIVTLSIGPVQKGKVAVSFRGRRRPRYSGQEPTPLEVSGHCILH